MNQKHKSARTYTHTHTHTIKFVHRVWTSCGRCAPWVSAFLRGIRRAVRSGTGHTLAMAEQAGRSSWASLRNGYWLFWMGPIGIQTTKQPQDLPSTEVLRYVGKNPLLPLLPMAFMSTIRQTITPLLIAAGTNSITFTAIDAAGKAAA